jgi:hypothetical protein
MTFSNYAERDEVITRHTYATVRRRDGLPHDLFQNYWRDVHAPLCSRLPGLSYYAQQHFSRDHQAHLWPLADGVRPITAVLDGVAEIGFADDAGQQAFGAAGPILYGDEFNLFSEAVAYSMPNGFKTFVDRQENGAWNGADPLHRVHVLMSRKPGEDTTDWLIETAGDLAFRPAVQKLKLLLPEPYDNAHPAPPSPNVGHHVDDDRLNLAILEIAFESNRVSREFFGTPEFQKMLADQAKHIDAIGAYLVTGVYVFVRDGKPTLAGLRGSRPAQLIEQVGAANQAAAEVSNKFVRTDL